MTNTFRRNAVAICKLVQRQLALGQPAALDDIAAAVVEIPDRGRADDKLARHDGSLRPVAGPPALQGEPLPRSGQRTPIR